MVCTLDSRGFRNFRGFRDFRESSTQLLDCSCLSCLCRFRRFRDFCRFRDFRRFRERRPTRKPQVCQTIGLPNIRILGGTLRDNLGERNAIPYPIRLPLTTWTGSCA